MNAVRVLSILLVLLGLIGLSLGQFHYLTELPVSGQRPVQLEIAFSIPRWFSGGVLLAGVALFFSAKRKR
ncbi:hypothetical protein [Chitinimonas taiwanensis]|jgi:hypothetical protein|uniref:Uncharacterized protein n=1 Tax=Chitinimonas taiwanensis DSM 18899 TaxID=1121279 RepID=A0A1K2H9N9_9NEIS|nr:hypothetical protein [Chitinimonas taiwanensis]SFZ73511.1 hypothetical protein SAMN02745887_00865 [Chitinimonas taiwanensis DSM 18899]